jgi:hypothetical protein
MNAGTISAVVMAALMLIAAIGGVGRWLYRRGRDEQSLSSSVRELAVQVGKLADKLDKHGDQLTDHEIRLRAGGL